MLEKWFAELNSHKMITALSKLRNSQERIHFGTCEAPINKHCAIRDHSIDYDRFIENYISFCWNRFFKWNTTLQCIWTQESVLVLLNPRFQSWICSARTNMVIKTATRWKETREKYACILQNRIHKSASKSLCQTRMSMLKCSKQNKTKNGRDERWR